MQQAHNGAPAITLAITTPAITQASPTRRRAPAPRAALPAFIAALTLACAPLHASAGTQAAPPGNLSAGDPPPFDQAFADLAAPPPVEVPADAVDLAELPPPPQEAPLIRTLGTGIASYYGRRFHGRPTASGERFDMHALTAAHKTLPFGARVQITNPANGRSVTVRINDRGPFVRGRTIDVSRAAAAQIGLIASGHGEVELALVGR